MKLSTFFFLIKRGVRNLGTHWAMTAACIASLGVCMTLNIAASLAEVNVDGMVNYLGQQNETVVFLDPECDSETEQAAGDALAVLPGVTNVQYVSKDNVLEIYSERMEDYASLWEEFKNDNPFKANYRVTIEDLSQLQSLTEQMKRIDGVYSVAAPLEMSRVFVQVQQAVTKAGNILILVLMAVSVITVGSTIRLSVFARRREIEIMKYVGATNGLVTLPFLVEGLVMGLLSGALAAGVTIGGYGYLVQAAGGMGSLWQILSGSTLVPLEKVWQNILLYSLSGGALVGGLGSLFSIRKHLNV
ncbi:MAG: permease-like cell division protein FtsX [Faecalibacterium sp.]